MERAEISRNTKSPLFGSRGPQVRIFPPRPAFALRATAWRASAEPTMARSAKAGAAEAKRGRAAGAAARVPGLARCPSGTEEDDNARTHLQAGTDGHAVRQGGV